MQNSKQLKTHQRRLRKSLTLSEKLFQQGLQKLNIPYKVNMVLGNYILDFCLPTKMLNVEIDGSSHIGNEWKDGMRDKFCNSCCLKVIRIKNEDVAKFNFDELLKIQD